MMQCLRHKHKEIHQIAKEKPKEIVAQKYNNN